MVRKEEPLQMRIGEAKQRDVGKKRARVGPEAMDFLKSEPGDIIEIMGSRTTCAVIWPADEDEKFPDIIRIDGQTRKNVGGTLNDIVKIRKVSSKNAKTITLTPVNDTITIDKEFTDFVKNRLKGLPITHGDEISVMILGNSMDFKITKTAPKGIINIDKMTEVNISTETSIDRKVRVTYEEVGGLKEKTKSMREIVELPLRHPELFTRLGVEPHSGILLYGPPGCGKTLLGRAVATETGANMILVRGPEILSKWMGESEKALREIFRKAKASSPCVVIFDELDALAKFRSNEGKTSETILSQLLTEIEESTSSRVAVIGITNRPDIIDNALLRAGRLDLVLYVSPPDEKGRLEIIKILTKKMPLSNDVKLQEIAVATQNYTGADLTALCREAAVHAMRNQSSKISSNDFATSLKQVKPSITKEVDQWYNTIRESISNVVPKTEEKAFYG